MKAKLLFILLFVLIAGLLSSYATAPENHQGLQLSKYKLDLIYTADFSKPLDVIYENDLFEAGKRVRKPQNCEWVFEGKGKPYTTDGELIVVNKGSHVVLWNTRTFPEDFLLELTFSLENSNNGLAIIFFCTTGKSGGDIFDYDQPYRNGNFRTYTLGQLDCYHVSYWSGNPRKDGRILTNLRKNHGSNVVSNGPDLFSGKGPGPHTVRLLKVGNRIQVEEAGRTVVDYTDEGSINGKVYGEGLIGLRTMEHSQKITYTDMKVYKVSRKNKLKLS